MGLRMLEAKVLSPINMPSNILAYKVPKISDLPGKSTSWVNTLDSLRPLKERGVNIDDWQEEIPNSDQLYLKLLIQWMRM